MSGDNLVSGVTGGVLAMIFVLAIVLGFSDVQSAHMQLSTYGSASAVCAVRSTFPVAVEVVLQFKLPSSFFPLSEPPTPGKQLREDRELIYTKVTR